MNKQKIEQMITDLLVRIHQEISNGNPVKMGDVELLETLERMLTFRIKLEQKHE